MFLPEYFYKFLLFQYHWLAQVVIGFWSICVVVIDIASDRSCHPFYMGIFFIFVDSFVFGILLMEHNGLIIELLDGRRVFIFNQSYRVLSIEIKRCFPCEITLPIHLNYDIIVSRLKFHINRSITVAVHRIIDVFGHIFGCFVNFHDDDPH